MSRENELSVFIDEAGDIGQYDCTRQPFSDRYYLISLVFHNQRDSIEQQVTYLNNRLRRDGFTADAIHSGPLIRKESPFREYSSEDVYQILRDMLCFIKKSPVLYHTVVIDKQRYATVEQLEVAITEQLTDFIEDYNKWLGDFQILKIYYDNGQKLVSKSIRNTFVNTFNCKLNIVKPSDYFLFQVADYICTLNLIEIKRQNSKMSSSEQRIFSPKIFKKMFYTEIIKKKI